jgi:hypothetical protein
MLLGALHSTHMMGLSQALLERLVLMSNAVMRATKNAKKPKKPVRLWANFAIGGGAWCLILIMMYKCWPKFREPRFPASRNTAYSNEVMLIVLYS